MNIFSKILLFGVIITMLDFGLLSNLPIDFNLGLVDYREMIVSGDNVRNINDDFSSSFPDTASGSQTNIGTDILRITDSLESAWTGVKLLFNFFTLPAGMMVNITDLLGLRSDILIWVVGFPLQIMYWLSMLLVLIRGVGDG